MEKISYLEFKQLVEDANEVGFSPFDMQKIMIGYRMIQEVFEQHGMEFCISDLSMKNALLENKKSRE